MIHQTDNYHQRDDNWVAYHSRHEPGRFELGHVVWLHHNTHCKLPLSVTKQPWWLKWSGPLHAWCWCDIPQWFGGQWEVSGCPIAINLWTICSVWEKLHNFQKPSIRFLHWWNERKCLPYLLFEVIKNMCLGFFQTVWCFFKAEWKIFIWGKMPVPPEKFSEWFILQNVPLHSVHFVHQVQKFNPTGSADSPVPQSSVNGGNNTSYSMCWQLPAVSFDLKSPIGVHTIKNKFAFKVRSNAKSNNERDIGSQALRSKLSKAEQVYLMG